MPANTTSVATTAAWSDLAATLISRMRDRLMPRSLPPCTMPLPQEDKAVQALLDELAGDAGTDAAAQAADRAPEPDRPRLPLRQLLLVLRVAATLGDAQGLDRLLARGAVTVLADLAPGEAAALIELFDAGALPEDWHRVDADDHYNRAEQRLVTLRPHERETPLRSDRERFEDGLIRALEGQAPALILLPSGHALPTGLCQAGLTRLRLAPLDRPILLYLLREQFGADGDAGAAAGAETGNGAEAETGDSADLLAALPEDEHLHRLDPVALLLALRAPTALAAAKRLARIVAPSDREAGLRLRDLVGYGEAKPAALGIIEDLAAWRRGDLAWNDVCRGLLLCGPPGTGKTELARAMAREGSIGFVAASYADWQKEGHLGHFLAAMAASFAQARRAAPAILFLDELDAFQSRSGERTRGNNNKSYDAKAIAGLLEQLDGIAGREGVVVIAACNHPEQLDPAIRRAGRFDHVLRIGPPDRQALAIILRQHLGTDLPGADLDSLAAQALGRTGADCAAALRVARAGARRQRRTMTLADLQAALIGKVPDFPVEQLWHTAIHEAGHAILHVAAGTGRPVSLSITEAGGLCHTDPARREITAGRLRRQRMSSLVGRAAEALVFGAITAGAGGPEDSDLSRATRLALAEEVSFGLGSLGPLWLADNPDPAMILHLPPAIQEAIRSRLLADETAALQVLIAHRPLLEEIATRLARRLLLTGQELDALLERVVPLPEEDTAAQALANLAAAAEEGQAGEAAAITELHPMTEPATPASATGKGTDDGAHPAPRPQTPRGGAEGDLAGATPPPCPGDPTPPG